MSTEEVERLKLQEQMHQAMIENSPRYLRARRTADMMHHIMQDFIPQDRKLQRYINQHLMDLAFQANIEIINVPPEWDELDKLQIERAMLDAKMKPVFIGMDFGAEPGISIPAEKPRS